MNRRIFLAVLLVSLAGRVVAQSAVPGTPDAPPQTNLPQAMPLDPKLPTLFIVGDSTASNGRDLGWGDHIAHYFDTTRINVANRARAGRSSRSYYNEGLWAKTLADIKPGDFVLFQMGHNDGAGNAESVRKDMKARGSLKGLGEETAEFPLAKPYLSGPLAGQAVETVHTFGWYNRKYIADTRAKGATPILLTPTIRNIWKPDAAGVPEIERDMGFHDFDVQLGAAEHVPVADMAAITRDRLQALGPEKTALLFPRDHTHTSAEGAEANAADVAEALRRIEPALAMYLKPR